MASSQLIDNITSQQVHVYRVKTFRCAACLDEAPYFALEDVPERASVHKFELLRDTLLTSRDLRFLQSRTAAIQAKSRCILVQLFEVPAVILDGCILFLLGSANAQLFARSFPDAFAEVASFTTFRRVWELMALETLLLLTSRHLQRQHEQLQEHSTKLFVGLQYAPLSLAFHDCQSLQNTSRTLSALYERLVEDENDLCLLSFGNQAALAALASQGGSGGQGTRPHGPHGPHGQSPEHMRALSYTQFARADSEALLDADGESVASSVGAGVGASFGFGIGAGAGASTPALQADRLHESVELSAAPALRRDPLHAARRPGGPARQFMQATDELLEALPVGVGSLVGLVDVYASQTMAIFLEARELSSRMGYNIRIFQIRLDRRRNKILQFSLTMTFIKVAGAVASVPTAILGMNLGNPWFAGSGPLYVKDNLDVFAVVTALTLALLVGTVAALYWRGRPLLKVA